MSRAGTRVIKGSFLNTLSLVLGVAVSFFLMPFMVSSLGDRMYGVWALVAEFLWFYGLMDFGLSSAVGRYLSRAVGSGEKDEVRRITATAFYLTCGLGLLAATATFGLAAAAGWFVEDFSDLRVFRVLLILVGMNFAVEFPVRVFNSVLGANLRFDIRTSVAIAKNLVTAGLIVAVLKAGHGVVAVALVTFVTSLADSAARIWFAWRTEPALSLRWRDVVPARIRLLYQYSVFSFVAKIADILRFKLDLFVITAHLGLGAVTPYYIGVRLIGYFTSFITSAVEVVGPVFSREEGKNDFDSIRSKFLLVTKISVYLSVFFGGMAVLYGRPFITRWMGAEYGDSYLVMLILILPAILALLQNPSEHLLYNISRHRFLAGAALLEGAANLALSLWLVRYYGILGVALGTAVPMTVRQLVQPFYVCHVLRLPLKSYAALVARNVAIATGLLTVLAWSTRPFVAPAYLSLALIGLVLTLAFWPMATFFGFARSERDYLLGFFRRPA